MPPDTPIAPPPRQGLAWHWWRDPVVLGGILVVVLLGSYQLAVLLLRPPWLSSATDWFLSVLAWLEVLVVALFSWWASRVHLPEALSWWLVSGALFFYAVSQALRLIGHEVLFAGHVPFPWWHNLFFLLQFPCFFLALLLLPGTAEPGGFRGLARLRVFFDSLLLVGAVTLLTWYFLLALIYLERDEPILGKITNLGYAVVSLCILFTLMLLFLYVRRPQTIHAAQGLLVVALLCLLVGDFWYSELTLFDAFQGGDPPDLFWLLCYLCFPLVALIQFRRHGFMQTTLTVWPSTPTDLDIQGQDLLDAIRFFLPLFAALCASVVILVLAGQQPLAGRNPLPALLLCFGLLALVLVRQGIVYLEQAQLRREREAARTTELALRQTTRQMETFLGMASHELRTPLTSITLHQGLMRRSLLRLASQKAMSAPEIDQEFRLLEKHWLGTQALLRRQERLINELLDISRIQAGRLEFHLRRIDLLGMVRAAVEEQREAWPERTLLLSLPAAGAAPISADPDRVGQVITHYLTNALRYSQEDRPVEVGVLLEPQQAEVLVRDQGPGLPPEERARIWERFHRAPGIEVQSGSGVGLGIGLYLSKIIIEHLGGQVGVQSAKGEGSTFWFTLPLALEQP